MANIRVLDLDLDFFLSSISRRETPRAENQGLVPWTASRVRQFLERNCALSQQRRLPGSVLATHDELFYRWRDLYYRRAIKSPLHVVHVDAHADLRGSIDGSWAQVMGELLHRPVSERADPRNGAALCGGGLNEANFLVFAIACRWIASLTYVFHPRLCAKGRSQDIPKIYLPEGSLRSHQLQLRAVEKARCNGATPIERIPTVHLEPAVPFRKVHPRRFHTLDSFDYVFLTQSPSYTPSSADSLVPVIREYISPM